MKLKMLVLTLVLAGVSLPLAGGCQGDKKKPTPKQEATRQWNRARADVLGGLARSQYESGNFDKSQQTLQEALRLNPASADLHVLAGKLAIEQGQLEQADRELSEARKLDEKNAEAEYLNGVVYQRWQKPRAAYECYARASQKAPNELAYLMAESEMLVAMNRSPEALSLLREKVDYFEHSAAIRDAVGQLLVEQGRYEEAVESLRQASILATDDLKVREHLGLALFYDHQYREAAEVLGRLLRDDAYAKRADLFLVMGECQMQLGRAGDARASFDEATQLRPSSLPGWISLAKAALQLGDTRRGEIAVRKALALESQSAEAHLLLGYIRLRQDRLQEAMGEFSRASSLDRGDPVSLCMMGYSLEKMGKRDEAIRCYGRALKLKPDDELANRLMASIEMGN